MDGEAFVEAMKRRIDAEIEEMHRRAAFDVLLACLIDDGRTEVAFTCPKCRRTSSDWQPLYEPHQCRHCGWKQLPM